MAYRQIHPNYSYKTLAAISLSLAIAGPVNGQNSDQRAATEEESPNSSVQNENTNTFYLEGRYRANYEGEAFDIIFSKNSNGIYGTLDVDFAQYCDNGAIFYRNGVLEGNQLSIDAIMCSSSQEWSVNGWIIDLNTAKIEIIFNGFKVPVIFEKIEQ